MLYIAFEVNSDNPKSDIAYKLFDPASGKIIEKGKLKKSGRVFSTEVEVKDHWAKGVYLLAIENEVGSIIRVAIE